MANRNTNKNTNQKGGKGGKGGKNKPEEEPAPDLITKDGETLRSMIMHFRDRLTDLKAKRSYAQEERDLINNFFENTRKDIDEHRDRVANKDTEAEQLEESHRVEVKVYLQKVKHLEYDQKLNNKRIKMEGDEAGRAEDEYHKDWLGHMKAEKTRKKKDYTETEKKHETDVQVLNQQQDKMMKKLKTEYDTKINNMINNYEELLRKLREDLELKIRVEIHEIEERKNQHINELMKNHEAAFTELKTYYNDITRENLQVIQGQKQDLENLQASLQTNNKLIAEIKAKNKKMEDPLNKNRKLRDELKYEVRLHEKDKMSLDNLKIKFATLKDKIRKLERAQEQLDARYLQVLQERKDLEDRFERITMEVKMHAELKNEVLAKKLGELENHFEYKETQLQQLVQRAAIDPSIVNQLLQKIQQSIESKNSLLKNLQYSIHHATKAYNDAVRVYETKLAEFGIPPDELGFEPLESKTSVMPAGLVSS